MASNCDHSLSRRPCVVLLLTFSNNSEFIQISGMQPLGEGGTKVCANGRDICQFNIATIAKTEKTILDEFFCRSPKADMVEELKPTTFARAVGIWSPLKLSLCA